MKLVVWTPEQAKRELKARLAAAKTDRKKYENTWKACELETFSVRASVGRPEDIEGSAMDYSSEAQEDGSATTSYNKIIKNVRFLHSQMSANPPSVIPRPNTSDQEDKRAALAADRTVQHIRRTYDLQEVSDQSNLNVLISGTGIIKLIQDPTKGDVLSFDENTGEILMEGDLSFTVPSYWNFYPKPCRSLEELSWAFEKINVPWEAAISRWPEHVEQLKKIRQNPEGLTDPETDSAFKNTEYDVITIYEYWERGEPHNGMLGRFAHCLEDGTILGTVRPNPNFTRSTDSKVATKVKRAHLPYHLITDIDQPNTLWGASVVAHALPWQQQLTQMQNTLLDAMEAHASAKLILPGEGEGEDDPISNSSFEVIRTNGAPGTDPKYVQPMPWPAIFQTAIQYSAQQVDDVMGVNESMFGQQSREQSALSLQTATNNGNMVRKRLFNKYVKQIQSLYKSALALAVEHWTDGKVIKIVGEENAFEVTDFKAADVQSGYDVIVEYGTSLSLDPSVRREEILQMMPILKEAGIPAGTLIRHIRLNELDNLYDLVSLADKRQKEYFDEMVALNKYLPPRELEDHQKMLEFAYKYVMTAEYKYLPEPSKELIDRHIKEREAMVVKGPALTPGAEQPLGAGEALPPQPLLPPQ